MAANKVSVYAIPMTVQCLAPEIAKALAWMSFDERQTHRRFRFNCHRREFALSRFILRGILGEFVGSDPALLSFLTHPEGKPYLRGDAQPSFNLTHTDDFVALITGPTGLSLGVDAEPLARKFDSNLLNHVFDDGERLRIDDVLDHEAFPVSYWTAKEAYLKQIGTGLSVAPNRLSLSSHRNGGTGVSLDGDCDRDSFLHFATIGKHRLCAATETVTPPRLYVYGGKKWEREDGLWSPSAPCSTPETTPSGTLARAA